MDDWGRVGDAQRNWKGLDRHPQKGEGQGEPERGGARARPSSLLDSSDVSPLVEDRHRLLTSRVERSARARHPGRRQGLL